ncbi:hypothetical protein NZNM25_01450 [Nitrosopumilus zosterae]|uniref:Uncharacterized protein n=1 Tax=Nitrosopumilus zosterae TaxID=718286 RepID=A0A2S2KP41_9ARCH|nr:hypothetical protein [Nitrosopumilus zosterae]BDQ31141.1 hypothetical protein NZOSNM25_001252 [Nitrosopumilus zosterae]GBH33354.1 hypothetical protein NZNM25_01450 [Nitrosopumilus zosterae]
MPTKIYQVIEEFELGKHCQPKMTPAVIKCLKLLRKGMEFQPKQFIEENQDYLTKRSKDRFNACQSLVSTSLKFGREMGIVQIKETKPISYQDFCNLDTIQYMSSQLRGSKTKNLKTKVGHDNSTKRHYTLQLHYFNNWLHGKSFDFNITKQIDVDTFKKERTRVTLDGIEHFLHLYQESMNSESDFVRVIKLYLMDEINKDCSAKYMLGKYSAIVSYFEKNDSPIKFKYNPFSVHDDYKEENADATLSLSDLHKLLANANPLEKAVVLCKFHRGLDSSTLGDRFNFQVAEQLIKWFDNADFDNWDLKKCPVPIKLTRIKTDYTHVGYLDADAIVAIQEYLNYKYSSFVTTSRRNGIDPNYLKDKSHFIEPEKPLFTNRLNEPITINWISRVVPRLAKKAGIQKFIKGNRLQNRSEKNGHELRDLLKSTLIISGCADYVCELSIGHKVGDSYEKQDKLYPEVSRSEYAKASSKINILSKVSNLLDNDGDTEQYKMMYDELKSNISEAIRSEMQTRLEELKKSVDLQIKNTEKRESDASALAEELIRKSKQHKMNPERKAKLREIYNIPKYT